MTILTIERMGDDGPKAYGLTYNLCSYEDIIFSRVRRTICAYSLNVSQKCTTLPHAEAMRHE